MAGGRRQQRQRFPSWRERGWILALHRDGRTAEEIATELGHSWTADQIEGVIRMHRNNPQSGDLLYQGRAEGLLPWVEGTGLRCEVCGRPVRQRRGAPVERRCEQHRAEAGAA